VVDAWDAGRVTDCDVVIVGAGPYGLSIAAHLRRRGGPSVRVFGDPMSFWRDRMPAGMLLRSPYVASNIADPNRELTLSDYRSATGRQFDAPVPLERFVDYGRWFRGQVAPDADLRWVSRLARQNGHFELRIGDEEERLTTKQVVVAAGVSPFARIPTVFAALDRDRVSHASDHRDLSVLAGRRVLVVGGGQSALESAALLLEHDASPELLVRATRIFYLGRVPLLHRLGPITRLLYAPPEVGPAGLSRLVATPNCYRRFPRRWQNSWGVRAIRPAGAAWLRPRLEGVTITTGRTAASATPAQEGVEIQLDDGSRRHVDHVLLATGYDVDITRYRFLAPESLDAIARRGGYPKLRGAFMTSVPGLRIVGAPAAWSYGPLMRFVAGTEFTAPRVATELLASGRRSVPRR
jgi:FAD-dependent urate hydroxylase